jgi:hypothetical protein
LFEATKALKKKPRGGKPFTSDYSGDLRTYVAYQEIDNVGVHCYYALSNQPITVWHRFDETIFPTGISPAGIKGAGLSDEDEPTPSQSKGLLLGCVSQ